jgi:hypothetical protein
MDDGVVSFRFNRNLKMIGKQTNVTLNGKVKEALRLYCARHGIKRAVEGIRQLIRETPEYKALTEIPEPPTKIPDDENLSDSTSQPAVG